MSEIWSNRIQNELITLTNNNNNNSLPKNTLIKKHLLNLQNESCFLLIFLSIEENKKVFFVVDAGGANFANFPFEAPVIFLFFVDGDLPRNSTLECVVRNNNNNIDEAKIIHLFDNFHQIQKRVHHVIPLDIDWSPGLTLSDMITHTALKLRESFLQNEALHCDANLADVGLGVYGEQHVMENFNAGTAKLAEYFTKFSNKVDASLATKKTQRVDLDAFKGTLYECEAVGGKKTKVGSFFQQFLSKKHYLAVTNEFIYEVDQEGLLITKKSLKDLQKLKFRRGESINLQFFSEDQQKSHNLVYLCHKAEVLVKEIQQKMQKLGVEGKHSNTLKNRAVTSALNILELLNLKNSEEIQKIDEIDEIMDLYRQAAEKFAFAEDPRYHEVLKKMHNFLNQPWVQAILSMDDVTPPPPLTPKKNSEPQPEILETPKFLLDEFYDDKNSNNSKNEKPAVSTASSSVVDDNDGIENVISDDLNDFLKEADQQLADLMKD